MLVKILLMVLISINVVLSDSCRELKTKNIKKQILKHKYICLEFNVDRPGCTACNKVRTILDNICSADDLGVRLRRINCDRTENKLYCSIITRNIYPRLVCFRDFEFPIVYTGYARDYNYEPKFRLFMRKSCSCGLETDFHIESEDDTQSSGTTRESNGWASYGNLESNESSSISSSSSESIDRSSESSSSIGSIDSSLDPSINGSNESSSKPPSSVGLEPPKRDLNDSSLESLSSSGSMGIIFVPSINGSKESSSDSRSRVSLELPKHDSNDSSSELLSNIGSIDSNLDPSINVLNESSLKPPSSVSLESPKHDSGSESSSSTGSIDSSLELPTNVSNTNLDLHSSVESIDCSSLELRLNCTCVKLPPLTSSTDDNDSLSNSTESISNHRSWLLFLLEKIFKIII